MTVSDTGNAALVGASGTIGVGSGSLSKLLLTAPSSTASGAPIQVTVAAADVYGNTTPSYTGTVHVQSSDAQAMLPPNYSFTSADKGFHTFSITLRTIGSQSVTAADTTTTSLLGSVGVAVNASTTIPLTAGAGWNLVGGDPLSIWSDATAAWSWNASTGTWSSLTSSSPAQSEGTGAWEQLSSTAAAASHSVTAQVCSSAVSLPILPHRWNMVGNPCSVAVSLPAGIHAFWWDPSRQTYVPATTIAAGAAAWILAPAGSVSLTPD